MKKQIIAAISVLFVLTVANIALAQNADQYAQKAEKFSSEERFLDAAQMMEKSIAAERSSTNINLNSLAEKLDSAGYYYEVAGQYNKATELYEEAISLRNTVKRSE